MCTVTYIPPTLGRSFILTSSRDENPGRETISPCAYHENGRTLIYPKDKLGGGTWIAISERGRICCLLNGGFTAHLKQPYHTVSRGVVLRDLTSADISLKDFFVGVDLHVVEPFTLVMLEEKSGGVASFEQLIWDGYQAYYQQLDPASFYIWSSSTLYSPSQQEARRLWFNEFVGRNGAAITSTLVKEFHEAKHTDDTTINIVMDRGSSLKTLSISQVVWSDGHLTFCYDDRVGNKQSALEL